MWSAVRAVAADAGRQLRWERVRPDWIGGGNGGRPKLADAGANRATLVRTGPSSAPAPPNLGPFRPNRGPSPPKLCASHAQERVRSDAYRRRSGVDPTRRRCSVDLGANPGWIQALDPGPGSIGGNDPGSGVDRFGIRRSGVALASLWCRLRAGVNPGPIRGVRANPVGSIRGQPGVDLGPPRRGSKVASGWAQGRFGVDPGSLRGEAGIRGRCPRSICGRSGVDPESMWRRPPGARAQRTPDRRGRPECGGETHIDLPRGNDPPTAHRSTQKPARLQ